MEPYLQYPISGYHGWNIYNIVGENRGKSSTLMDFPAMLPRFCNRCQGEIPRNHPHQTGARWRSVVCGSGRHSTGVMFQDVASVAGDTHKLS